MLGGVDVKVRAFIEVLDVLAEADEPHLVLRQAKGLYLLLAGLQQGAVPRQHQGEGHRAQLGEALDGIDEVFVALVVGEPGGAEHHEAVRRDAQLLPHGGRAPLPRPDLRIHGVENDLDVSAAPAIGDEPLPAPVAHGDHLVLPLVQQAVGQTGDGVVGQDEVVGVDHPDLLIVTFRQHGDVVFPQVVAVDEVDVPLLAQLGQRLGGLPVEPAGHGELAGGDPHGLQPLHQEPALIVGEERLHPAVGGEVGDQGLHIPLGPGLSSEV